MTGIGRGITKEGPTYHNIIHISFAQFIPVYVGLAQARPNYIPCALCSYCRVVLQQSTVFESELFDLTTLTYTMFEMYAVTSMHFSRVGVVDKPQVP